ncbi:MAG: sugar phosphate isomerase/epimerase [Clostridia bacterium]|nr:sugar phosphate isomerase/epimerase [Clostridia bacterium]
MKIGLSAAAFYGLMETEEQAAYIRRFPIDTCEIFLETHCEYTKSFGELVREKLGDMHCTSVHPKGTQFEPDIFARSMHQYHDGMKAFRGVLDSAQAIGAKYYVMHGPHSVSSRMTIDRIHQLQPRFAEMAGEAAEKGIELLYENVCWAALRTTDDVARLTELLPDIHFVLDIKQAQRAGVDPFDMLHAMGSRIRHVHLLDWDEQGRVCLPGQGCFDFPRLFDEMHQMDYDGTFLLEPYTTPPERENELLEALSYLRKTAKQAYGKPHRT